MKRSDFYIGMEFFTGAGKWCCTDIGTRVIVAISLESVLKMDRIALGDGNTTPTSVPNGSE
jgi:hypothetical protein